MTDENATSRLDEIDSRILQLLRQRLELRKQLGAAGDDLSVHESNWIKQQIEDAAQVFPHEHLTAFIRFARSLCDAQVTDQKVAFLGPQHSYSHLAAIKYFGEGAAMVPATSIAAVFDSVLRGDTSLGIVPVENSTDGRVVDTLGMFVREPVNICGEVLLPIHHYLLSKTPREEITDVYSKPQALSQCRGWLSKHLPAAKLNEMSSTAAAAKLAAQEHGIAAIASEPAGRQYGLNVIAPSIEDSSHNVTRFAVLGADRPLPTGSDKTSLLFQVLHRPGALADVMAIFQRNQLNMTWIESFPMPDTPSEYHFFVELEGHEQDPKVADALEKLAEITHQCDVWGSYPRHIIA